MSMKRLLLLGALAVFMLPLNALDVVNTAGGLHLQVTDLNVTELKISGTMNAEDFYFIADNLHKLQLIDLVSAKIQPCTTSRRHYWQREFMANELPTGAFGGMTLTTARLPMGLKSIGKAAFAGCSRLKTVMWPNSLDSIADYAFAGCAALTSVNLPASVTVVGAGAFMRCTSLMSLTVGASSKLRKLDATALLDCPKLKVLSLGTSLQQIGERALAGTALPTLDLTTSKNLLDVGDWVIVKTPVTEAKFPASLRNLGEGAFLYANNLKHIELGGNLEQLNDYLLAGTGIEGGIDLTGVETIGDYALYNVSSLSVVELPATVTWLGSYAMAGMTGMTSISSEASEVPLLGEHVWLGVNQSQIPITVPKSSLNMYKAADQWKEFRYGPSWLKGDVNGDGEVNIADINALIEVILTKRADAELMRRADVNEDNEINLADINALIDIILGPGKGLATPQVDTNDQLRIADLMMKPNEVRDVQLVLDNADAYSALQCDIVLPQGLTLLAVNGVKGYESENSEIDASTSRALTYSMKKAEFTGEQVLCLTLQSDGSLGCDGQLLLTNVVLADADNVGWHAADYAARVTNSTGVEELTATADHRVWVEGRTLCVETSQDAMAQVVAISGTAVSMELKTGVNRYNLAPGFYVVVVNGKSYKIAIR